VIATERGGVEFCSDFANGNPSGGVPPEARGFVTYFNSGCNRSGRARAIISRGDWRRRGSHRARGGDDKPPDRRHSRIWQEFPDYGVTPNKGRVDPPQTLPDLLREGLDIVFVGINPGLYSAQQGHYFARRTNRFWPAFSSSRLSRSARSGLRVTLLEPAHDAALLDFGFGFTDVVKRPTGNAAELTPDEFAAAAPLLLEKLAAHRPRVACFHGLTGYRPFSRAVFADHRSALELGRQPRTIGDTQIFVVPNPSPANAHFTPAEQAGWYDHLAAFMAETKPPQRKL